MNTTKLFLYALPWVIALSLAGGLFFTLQSNQPPNTTVSNSTVLQKIEALGKLELVKYNFKEITELNESLAEFVGIKFFESSIVLISKGEAVGCVDLSKVTAENIRFSGDSLVTVILPRPILCYYKLDLTDTKIFSLKTATFSNNQAFLEKAYAIAEDEIKRAALASGLLQQAEENAHLILRPFLEEVSGKQVIIQFSPGITVGPPVQ